MVMSGAIKNREMKPKIVQDPVVAHPNLYPTIAAVVQAHEVASQALQDPVNKSHGMKTKDAESCQPFSGMTYIKFALYSL